MPETHITNDDVNRAIRETVWPRLKDAGFTEHTARNAWRRRTGQVDVVTFQSFNGYEATHLGVTRFSFSVHLGILVGRPWWQAREKEGIARPRPHQSSCHLRRQLHKQLTQPEFPRTDIWFIKDDGSNLTDVVDDALAVLEAEGLEWFDTLDTPERILTYVREAPESAAACGMGAPDSPTREHLIARLEDALTRP